MSIDLRAQHKGRATLIAQDSTQAVITCKNRDTKGIKSSLWCNLRSEGGGERAEEGESEGSTERGWEREKEGRRVTGLLKIWQKKQSKKVCGSIRVAGDGRIMTEGGGCVTSDDLWLGCWEELKEMGATAMLTWWGILPPVRWPLFLR